MSMNELAAAACELRDALRQRGMIPRNFPQSEARQLAEHRLATAIVGMGAALDRLSPDPHGLRPDQVKRAIRELRALVAPDVAVEGANFTKMESIAGTAVNVLINAGANVAGTIGDSEWDGRSAQARRATQSATGSRPSTDQSSMLLRVIANRVRGIPTSRTCGAHLIDKATIAGGLIVEAMRFGLFEEAEYVDLRVIIRKSLAREFQYQQTQRLASDGTVIPPPEWHVFTNVTQWLYFRDGRSEASFNEALLAAGCSILADLIERTALAMEVPPRDPGVGVDSASGSTGPSAEALAKPKWSRPCQLSQIATILRCEPRTRTVKPKLQALDSDLRSVGTAGYQVLLNSLTGVLREQLESL